jgi:hypothetical protein
MERNMIAFVSPLEPLSPTAWPASRTCGRASELPMDPCLFSRSRSQLPDNPEALLFRHFISNVLLLRIPPSTSLITMAVSA